MKNKVMAFTFAAVVSMAGVSMAEEGMVKEAAAPAVEQAAVVAAPVVVGNKICPITGKAVGEMGAPDTVEYNGKIYNLCCPGCKEQFLVDAEKFSKAAEAEVATAEVPMAAEVPAAVEAPAAK